MSAKIAKHRETAAGRWLYDLPYLLTGLLNQHPRTAIKFKEAELKGEKGDILKFHDTVTDQE